MEIRQAEFISSYADHTKCPAPTMPEFAFIGRSNVGKSSLINMLTRRKGLAKISGKPGKTQTINHFLINEAWYLVDLPGYGYASVSKSLKKGWSKMIEDYLLNRPNLYCLFILIDCRLDPQPIDVGFIHWAGSNGLPICLVFTKTDKISKNALMASRTKYEKKLSESWAELPTILLSSSSTGTGRSDILQFIEAALRR